MLISAGREDAVRSARARRAKTRAARAVEGVGWVRDSGAGYEGRKRGGGVSLMGRCFESGGKGRERGGKGREGNGRGRYHIHGYAEDVDEVLVDDCGGGG